MLFSSDVEIILELGLTQRLSGSPWCASSLADWPQRKQAKRPKACDKGNYLIGRLYPPRRPRTPDIAKANRQVRTLLPAHLLGSLTTLPSLKQ